LQPPDKPWAAFGEGIDFVEPGDKSRHDRVLDWCLDAANIDLSDMIVAHSSLQHDWFV
jgi:hypothetical protein